jgi:hypothetical protein
LPNSGVEVDLPLIGFYRRQSARCGLTPDVTVRLTSDDVARGRDPEVAAVRRLVARASGDRSRQADRR